MKNSIVYICFIVLAGLSVVKPFIRSDGDGVCLAQEQKVSNVTVLECIQKLFDHSYDDPKSMTSGRSQAAIDLGFQKDTSAVMPLIKVLEEDEYNDVRKSAAYALGMLRDKRAVTVLVNALNDKCVGVQLEAAGSLISLGMTYDEKVFLKLEEIARGKNQKQWDINGFFGILRTPEREQNLKDYLRAGAILYLGEIKTEKTKQVIESLTSDTSQIVRESAQNVLKKIKE